MPTLPKKAKDLTGIKVGMLTVVGYAGQNDYGRSSWLCRCDCGNEIVRDGGIITGAYRKGKKSHCGCSPHLKRHGLTKGNQRLYWVWAAIIQRCENPTNKDYPGYGGRGISICHEWRNDFGSFHSWAISSGYRDGLTIERVDVNGNYEPSNCTWIVNERQAFNTRRSNLLTHNGKTQTISDWAAETGISYKTIRGRIFQYGWSVERALTEQAVKGKNQYA